MWSGACLTSKLYDKIIKQKNCLRIYLVKRQNGSSLAKILYLKMLYNALFQNVSTLIVKMVKWRVLYFTQVFSILNIIKTDFKSLLHRECTFIH
jgi:hypothetical protein